MSLLRDFSKQLDLGDQQGDLGLVVAGPAAIDASAVLANGEPRRHDVDVRVQHHRRRVRPGHPRHGGHQIASAGVNLFDRVLGGRASCTPCLAGKMPASQLHRVEGRRVLGVGGNRRIDRDSLDHRCGVGGGNLALDDVE